MTTYYMNENIERESIVVYNDKPSEYQDLIDAYIAKGGKITICPPGKASGALDLGKYQPSMDPKRPSGPDAWDNYFDLNHVDGNMFDVDKQVNNIKRVAG